MGTLTLYQLPPSPNSMKARLALALKKIPYTSVVIDPMDRATVVEVSGQPLTPVLVHGDRVVYDSYAIVRYLDANWKGEPRLFAADPARQRAIEAWELVTRTDLGRMVGPLVQQLFSGQDDPAATAEANRIAADVAGRVQEALGAHDFLFGAAPCAADLTVAPFLYYATLSPETADAKNPLAGFFARKLALPAAGFERARAWVARVMALES